MNINVAVLGGGSWGTTVASLVARNTPTSIWARNPDTIDEINRNHTNNRYLPDATLSKNLRGTADLEEAVRAADVLVVGIPSQNFRTILEEVKPYVRPWIPIVSLSKGLEKDSKLRMTQIIEEVLPSHPAGVLSGPNLAREIIAGQAAASVIATEDESIVKALQSLFHTGLFRVYTNTDVIGCELGGVLKNIVAIATGMGDGLGAGDNTRAGLITRGLAELSRLGQAMGGQASTFSGLAGMGDLVATCTSQLSRNRYVGEQLGKGRQLQEIIDEMHMVAEGVKSVASVMELANEHQVIMPITEEVYRIAQGTSTPKQAFRGLIRTETGAESDPG